MATVDVIQSGYVRESGTRVGSSISLVRDGDALIVVDPGLVASPFTRSSTRSRRSALRRRP